MYKALNQQTEEGKEGPKKGGGNELSEMKSKPS